MATARRSKRSAPPTDAIVLSGPPTSLHATVTVENTSEGRLAVRGATLHLDDGTPVPGVAGAVISAGSTASLPVRVSLDPTTAPGTYAAELEVSGARRSAVIRVQTRLALSVSPDEVLAVAGRHPIDLDVANDGNVAIPLARRVVAPTDDGRGEPGPEVTLEVDNPTTLEPGDQVTLSGRLDVPHGLDPARRHAARVPVGVADLVVLVLPHTETETPS
ncbi:hypothetical protein [uncultured Phycicoccus sp.]|uniref:hypothetical protein n=1 Tax=uncultured Phycicoccus sp. TaxID=661422 RepID=UPI002631D5E9|nr:hypothetical protein [uncultured Phycicoccus sp.]